MSATPEGLFVTTEGRFHFLFAVAAVENVKMQYFNTSSNIYCAPKRDIMHNSIMLVYS